VQKCEHENVVLLMVLLFMFNVSQHHTTAFTYVSHHRTTAVVLKVCARRAEKFNLVQSLRVPEG
jgi:hypothetical protein